MTVRDEVLDTVEFLLRSRENQEFTIIEVVNEMNRRGTIYKESSIRTHICSRMRHGAHINFAVQYDDFVRVRRGVYQLNEHKKGAIKPIHKQ